MSSIEEILIWTEGFNDGVKAWVEGKSHESMENLTRRSRHNEDAHVEGWKAGYASAFQASETLRGLGKVVDTLRETSNR